MKKIVLYMDSMNASGGIERVVSNLLKNWASQYDICLITKDDGESFYELPHNVKRVSLNFPLFLNMNNRFQRMCKIITSTIRSRKRLKKMLNSILPDYVYTTNPMNSLEVFLCGRRWRNRLVISEHGSYYGYNAIYTRLKRFIYPRVYKLSVLNRMDSEIYKSWGADAVYIPHLCTYTAKEKNSLNTKVFLNVGRLTNDKRQLLLLDMWSKVKEKRGWQLWIVGSGECKELIEKKIDELELQDSVRLIPATKDIVSIYKQASCFVFSSKTEGFGMVLLEAMSFGVPCISFDCPSGPRDIVINERNGYLVPNNDEDGFVQALNTIIQAPDCVMNQLGEGAFHTVLNWSNESILRKWDEIFS